MVFTTWCVLFQAFTWIASFNHTATISGRCNYPHRSDEDAEMGESWPHWWAERKEPVQREREAEDKKEEKMIPKLRTGRAQNLGWSLFSFLHFSLTPNFSTIDIITFIIGKLNNIKICNHFGDLFCLNYSLFLLCKNKLSNKRVSFLRVRTMPYFPFLPIPAKPRHLLILPPNLALPILATLYYCLKYF